MTRKEKAFEKRKELEGKLDDLAKAIITDPIKLQEFAKNWRKGFHTYSFINYLMIHLQKPGASLCAGYNQWEKKHKRKVKKGEKALWVYAPMIVKNKKDYLVGQDKSGNDIIETREESELIGFRVVPVFDVSQTEGKEIDMGNNMSKFNGCKTNIQELFTKFDEYDCQYYNSQADGCTNGEYIKVAKRKNKAQEIASFFHELAHVMLGHCEKNGTEVGKELSRQRAELEAEATAFLICECIGIEHKEASAHYIGHWKGNTDTLEKSTYRVLSVAEKILKRIAKEA